MSAAVLAVLGFILCFLGALSVRLAVLIAGGGLGWLLAEAFDASAATMVLVAGAGAVGALVVSFLVSRFLFFVAGACVGSVIGAKLFVIADNGEHHWLLALVFVPAVAVVAGFLAQHYEKAFLRWGTAVAGAALLLSAVGRLGTSSTDVLWRPETALGGILFAVLWVVLSIVGHRVQTSGRVRRASAGHPG
ncbi:hypothetical protein [Nocardioides sp. CER19]|uniref:hypothetical protein n=1 Tax=Nocardioides sp. CER19 TaxID=3038538 RepID=UPI0024484E35|nr:hypothetical protein [Nocardioides sp. CER19]MDH2416005.1 hypothetical protein [Nocardioides sp. CER19]